MGYFLNFVTLILKNAFTFAPFLWSLGIICCIGVVSLFKRMCL